MEQPARKSLRLGQYDYRQPGYYFVTMCTHNRQALFTPFVGAVQRARPPEYACFLVKWLYEMENKFFGVEIDCCAVMPDHIHFILVMTPAHADASLQEMMKWYKTQTTNAYIRQVRREMLLPYEKHVWQRSYYDHIIRNDRDLFEIRKYIAENPLKWFLEADVM